MDLPSYPTHKRMQLYSIGQLYFRQKVLQLIHGICIGCKCYTVVTLGSINIYLKIQICQRFNYLSIRARKPGNWAGAGTFRIEAIHLISTSSILRDHQNQSLQKILCQYGMTLW